MIIMDTRPFVPHEAISLPGRVDLSAVVKMNNLLFQCPKKRKELGNITVICNRRDSCMSKKKDKQNKNNSCNRKGI